jgi:hypothetical protein
MRIAIAAHSARRVGGVEQYLAAVVPALVRAGHDVACWFETEDADHSPILDRGGQVTTWTAVRLPERGVPAVRQWRPDVVYAHGVADAAVERALVGVAPAVLFAHRTTARASAGRRRCRRRRRTAARGALAAPAAAYPRRCGWSPDDAAPLRAAARRLDLLDAYASIVVASRHMAASMRATCPSRRCVVGLPIESPRPLPPRRPRTRLAPLYLGRLEASRAPTSRSKPRPARPPRWRCRCTSRCRAPARCTSRWPLGRSS